MSYQELIPLSLTEIVGDFAFKDFANNGNIHSFFIGCLGYVGVVYYLIKSLQGSTVLYVNGAWDGLSALIESIAAYFILGERLESNYQVLGLVFIIIGLFFLKIPLKNVKNVPFPTLFKKL